MSAVYLHNSWKYIICKPWLIHGLLSQSVKVRYCLQAWRGQEEDRKPVGKKKKKKEEHANQIRLQFAENFPNVCVLDHAECFKEYFDK